MKRKGDLFIPENYKEAVKLELVLEFVNLTQTWPKHRVEALLEAMKDKALIEMCQSGAEGVTQVAAWVDDRAAQLEAEAA